MMLDSRLKTICDVLERAKATSKMDKERNVCVIRSNNKEAPITEDEQKLISEYLNLRNMAIDIEFVVDDDAKNTSPLVGETK